METIFLLLIMVAGTGGELCVARAMQRVGAVENFRPKTLIRTIGGALRVSWMWLGVLLMAIAFFSLLQMLSLENVSFVVPVTALGYVAGALGGRFFLGERVNWRRWAGVFLVCVGVTLVVIGRT